VTVSFIGGIKRRAGKNHWPAASHLQTLSQNVASSTVHQEPDSFELATIVVIGTYCIGSCKSNYHMITTTTAKMCANILQKFQRSAFSSQTSISSMLQEDSNNSPGCIKSSSNMISGFKQLQIWSVVSNFKYDLWFQTRRFFPLLGNYIYNVDLVLAKNSQNPNKKAYDN